MLKRSIIMEEYLEAGREYESVREKALQLKDEITNYN